MPQYDYEIVRFQFLSPLHIGNERSDYSVGGAILQSDAFHAAICHAWAKLGKQDWIPGKHDAQNSFVVSGLFPFVDDGPSTSYFLPRPLMKIDYSDKYPDYDTSLLKNLKKAKWVDISVFEALAHGKMSEQDGKLMEYDPGYLDRGYLSVNKLPADSTLKPIVPISNQVMPRARVSRTSLEDTIIYYIDRYYFYEAAGLYSFIHIDNKVEKEKLMERIKAALRLLQDEGLGTDRNIGHGKFIFAMRELSINLPEDSEYAINIGMYCPSDKQEWELFSESDKTEARAGYDLTLRGGWISEPWNSWRKRSVYMARPGGVFKTGGRTIAGKIVDVTPAGVGSKMNHEVWRSGRSIFLPCKG